MLSADIKLVGGASRSSLFPAGKADVARRGDVLQDRPAAMAAFAMAVGSLILAGAFSLLLVVGRLPVFTGLIPDPLFFKRCLVLHVDLALIVWFFSFAAGLYGLIPASGLSRMTYRIGLVLAGCGVLAMIAGSLITHSKPILSNYIPVIENAWYTGGIAAFLSGLGLCFANGRLFGRKREGFHAGSFIALKATAIAYLTALATFAVTYLKTPRELAPEIYYELLFWGGGHVLQVANTAGMLAAWLILLEALRKREVLSRVTASVLFVLLILPHLAGPIIALGGPLSGYYQPLFTRLMQWGIFPVVLVFVAAVLKEIWKWKREGGESWNPTICGLLGSAALAITGFVLGAMIRGSNTMVPAHYHAAIGAVTVAYMAVSYCLLQRFSIPLPIKPLRRLIPWQIAAFAVGQVVFAIGFGLAGSFGLGRKAYATEQHVRSAGEFLGLGIMAAGGLLAVAGGLLYLVLVTWPGYARQKAPSFSKRLNVPKVIS